jgi:single-strand DNA-binding protein
VINKVILLGNLGKDPEVRSTQSGSKIATFSVATSESWKKDGERQERTEWHRVVAFGKVAEIIEDYCQKGTTVYIEGCIRTRKWTDKDGNDRYSTEINIEQFGGKLKIVKGGVERGSGGSAASHSSGGTKGGGADNSDLDDDIPF